MAVLATHHLGRGYAIVMFSVPEMFAQADQTTFKTMLTSFRFGM